MRDHLTAITDTPIELTDAELDAVTGGQIECTVPPGQVGNLNSNACGLNENARNPEQRSFASFCECLITV